MTFRRLYGTVSACLAFACLALAPVTAHAQAAAPGWFGEQTPSAGWFGEPVRWDAGEQPPDVEPEGWWTCFRDGVCDYACTNWHRLCRDLHHLYGGEHLGELLVALAIAAPLANTSADRDLSNWYQRHVRTDESDRWARDLKPLGDHFLWFEIYGVALVAGKLTENTVAGSVTHEWANRSLRAVLIGGPLCGALQWGLGASRPEEHSSGWRPFHDTNGASGHAFIGAVPFLTAAAMTENRVAKAALFAGSLFNGWSRINDDAHFTSQVILGWTVAYLAVRSVSETEEEERNVRVLPMVTPEGPGVGVLIRY